jgi:hypothetical protein
MPGFTKTLMGSGFSAGQAQGAGGFATTGATATGASQGTAYVLQNEYTVFTTVAAATGAILPAPAVGIVPTDALFVANNGANALTVYPPVGGAIGTAAVNTGVSVPANKTAFFVALSGGNYVASVSA